MRTTMTLDDDLYRLLEQQAKRMDLPFRQVIDQALRAGLGVLKGDQAPTPPFEVRTFSSGLRPGIDPTKLNQLVDDLEIEDVIAKLGRRE